MIRGDFEGIALLRSLGVEHFEDITGAVLTFAAGSLPTLVVTRAVYDAGELTFPTEEFHLTPVDAEVSA